MEMLVTRCHVTLTLDLLTPQLTLSGRPWFCSYPGCRGPTRNRIPTGTAEIDNPAEIQITMSAICEGGSGTTSVEISETVSISM